MNMPVSGKWKRVRNKSIQKGNKKKKKKKPKEEEEEESIEAHYLLP